MSVKFFLTTILTVCGPLLASLTLTNITPTQVPQRIKALETPIVVEPSLQCERADNHPGLHLVITNRGSSNISAGRTIHFSYQLRSVQLSGEGQVRLVNSLVSGQALRIVVSEVRAESFQACSATATQSTMIEGPVIKFPYIIAPRQP